MRLEKTAFDTPTPRPSATLVGLLLTQVWVMTPTALIGQEPPDSVIQLDSVVVSVLRGHTVRERAPYQISVLTEEELQRGNIGFSLEEALQALPGVQIQNRYNYAVGERISMRGFGARAQFGARGIKILVDGIPATLPDGQATLDHLDLGSLGRVEALRGPASALYGNGSGGVLSFETRSPPQVRAREEARAVVGENGLFRVESQTSGTINTTSYLVNVARLDFNGFRTDPGDPDELYGSAERLNVNAQVTTDVFGGRLRTTLNFMDLDAESPGSLTHDALVSGVVDAHDFNVVQQAQKDVQQAQLGVGWEGRLGSLSAQFHSWGVLRDLDNPIPPSVIDLERTAWGARAIVESTPTSRGASWSAGFEIEGQRDDRLNFDNEQGNRGALTLDQQERVRATGLFAQLRAELSERFSVVAGLRYDRVRFTADDRLVRVGNPDDSGSRTVQALSPTVGIHAQVAPTFSVFANLTTSFETPTTTEFVNNPGQSGGLNANLDPTRGVAGEVGARGTVGGASFEGSLYVTALDDELVPFEDTAQSGRTFFRNAGSSTYWGFESAATLPFGRGLSARVSYTYLDAAFDEFQVDGEVFDGNRIPGVASHKAEALIRWINDFAFAELRGDYVGTVAVNDSNSGESPDYALVDLRAGITNWALGRWSAKPFAGVNNLLDKRYAAAVSVNAFGGRFFEPGPGRSFYLGLSLSR